MTPFDFINAITQNKKDLIRSSDDPAQAEKEYNDITAKKEQAQKDLDVLLSKQAQAKAETEFLKQTKAKPKKTSEEKIEAANVKIKKGIDGAREALKKLRTGESGLSVVPLPGIRELAVIAPHVKIALEGLIAKGIIKLSDAVKELHEQFKDVLEGITEKDIHNIIAGEYNEKRKTKSELAERKKDIVDEAKYINQLENLLSGEQPKEPRKKIARNKQITELKKKIKE